MRSSPSVVITLTTLLLVGTATAQNGSNFKVLSNGFDAVYAGLGAGGSQVAGVDGFGCFVHGEEVRGNTLTVLGDFGYKEVAWRESLCVLGPATQPLVLDFPLLAIVEHDGVNPWTVGAVFTRLACPTSGCTPLGTSAGLAPYGTPPGSSASFLLAGLPSGLGLPSSASLLLPNIGLLPSSNGGTATLIAAAATSVPIGSTGLCWVVQFGWAPTVLAALDDINGWWRWHTNGRDGHQYWGLSTDELGLWQSQTVFTDAGATALQAFFANLDYEVQLLALDPVTNDALAPTGSTGNGVFYGVGAGVPHSGNSVNGGFDMGRHGGWATDGISGVPNPGTGLGNQDPAGSPSAGLIPTLGFVSYSNGPITSGSLFRAVWLQIDYDLTFGVDPSLATDSLAYFGQVRRPISVPASTPGPWPQAFTIVLLPLMVHEVPEVAAGNGWPDPSGFQSGTFGITMRVGSTLHMPLANSAAWNLGLPLGFQGGSTGLDSAMGPFPRAPIGTGSPSLGTRLGATGGP